MPRMMTCRDCAEPVAAHLAHIRSVAFSQVAYCGGCWTSHVMQAEQSRPDDGVVVPFPRTPADFRQPTTV